MTEDCPDADVLVAFAEGRLAHDQIGLLEEHVSSCDACELVLADLSGAAPDLASGQKVDRYQVLFRVGRGAFGTVYAAYDPRLDRRVALKILARSAPDTEQRMLREARAMARVSSPHVVTVHDAGTCPAGVYAAMDFVDGPSLAAWLDAEPRSVPEVLATFAQAGRGLAAAHAAGIIHRDFKPENVLVRPDGRVAVTDFGLARTTAPVGGTSEGHGPADQSSIAGTPRFMAPELLRGAPADMRSDIFSFCVALYAALYGGFPSEVPPRRRSVPNHVRNILLAGLSDDPSGRPASMHTVLNALEARRSRLQWFGAAALGVAFSVGAAVWWGRPSIDACRNNTPMWTDHHRQQVSSALLGTAHPNAGDTWERIALSLDRYAARWSDQWATACDLPADDRARAQVGCLNERRHRFTTLVGQLAAVDRAEVDFASAAVFALPSLDVCLGTSVTEALPARGALDPSVLASLDRARTLRDLGRTDEALAALDPLLGTARTSADLGLEAEILLTVGDIRLARDPVRAAEGLHAAAAAAAAAGRLDLEAQAKILLVSALSRSAVPDERVETELAYAEALVARLNDPSLRASLLYARGQLNKVARDRPDLSLADDEAYLQAARALYGDEHPKVAEALDNLASTYLGLSRDEESIALHVEAYAMRVAIHGPDHPGTISARGNLSLAYLELGRIGEAVLLAEENRASAARGLPPADAAASSARAAAAVLLEGAGRATEALELLPVPEVLDDGRGQLVARFGVPVMALAEIGGPEASAEADRVTSELLQIVRRNLDADDSETWGALELRGLALAMAGRCAEAIPLYDEAIAGIENDPSDTYMADWVRGIRATCWAALGRPDAAERDLRAAVREVEEANGVDSLWLAEPLSTLALFLAREGRTEEARALAERALSVWPGKVGVRAALGHYVLGLALARSDPEAGRRELLLARDALGEGIDQCRLGDDILRALGEAPRPRRYTR